MASTDRRAGGGGGTRDLSISSRISETTECGLGTLRTVCWEYNFLWDNCSNGWRLADFQNGVQMLW